MPSITGGISIARLRSSSIGRENNTSDSTPTNKFYNRSMKSERISVRMMKKDSTPRIVSRRVRRRASIAFPSFVFLNMAAPFHIWHLFIHYTVYHSVPQKKRTQHQAPFSHRRPPCCHLRSVYRQQSDYYMLTFGSPLTNGRPPSKIDTVICGCSSSVERQLPKLHRWVRLPSAAPKGKTSAFSRCLSFWVPPPEGRLHPSAFQCSAGLLWA